MTVQTEETGKLPQRATEEETQITCKKVYKNVGKICEPVQNLCAYGKWKIPRATTMYWAVERTEHFLKIYMCKQYSIHTHIHTHFLLMKLALSKILYQYELHILNSVKEPIMKESSEAGKLSLFEYIACSRFRLVEHYLKLIYWSIKSSRKICREKVIQLSYYNELNGNYFYVFFNKFWCDRLCWLL